MNTTASPKATLTTLFPTETESHLDERSQRAIREPMSVLPLGDGLYEVETETDDTYLGDLEAGRCTCPDHVFRGVRCKHLRRVAIEITLGRTPPPGELAVPCTDCSEPVFVDEDADGPVYCDVHSLSPGDAAIDRETGDRLTVVDVSDRRADAVRIRSADCTVAEYPTNESYDPDEPVVGAVYPHARVARNGVVPPSLRVYVYPRTRLRRIASSESNSAGDATQSVSSSS